MTEHTHGDNKTCVACDDDYIADQAAEALGKLSCHPRYISNEDILSMLTKHIRAIVRQELKAIAQNTKLPIE